MDTCDPSRVTVDVGINILTADIEWCVYCEDCGYTGEWRKTQEEIRVDSIAHCGSDE